MNRGLAAALAALSLWATTSCGAVGGSPDAAETTVRAAVWGDGLVDHQAGYRLSHVKAESGAVGRIRFDLDTGGAQVTEVMSWYWSKDLRYLDRAMAQPTPDGAWEAEFPNSPGGAGHFVIAFDSGDDEIGELVLGTDLVGPRSERKAPAARAAAGDVQKVGRYDVSLSGELLLAQPSKLTVAVSSAGKPVKFADAEVAAVSVASGAFARFEAGPGRTFTGTPSSPGQFRVVVDVMTTDGPLHAVFERTAFG